MVVKIIKNPNNHWYSIGSEFNVTNHDNLLYIITEGVDKGYYIDKDDCVVLDFLKSLESFSNTTCVVDECIIHEPEQITERFARKLVDGLGYETSEVCQAEEDIIEEWKEAGYIKQSREQELKETIDEIMNISSNTHKNLEYKNIGVFAKR